MKQYLVNDLAIMGGRPSTCTMWTMYGPGPFPWLAFERSIGMLHVPTTHCHAPDTSSPPIVHAHDDVIKWKHFPRYWLFVRGIHRSPVNSPHKGQWRGALKFSLICAWIYCWVNNREAADLRRHRAHYDVIVMYRYLLNIYNATEKSKAYCKHASYLFGETPIKNCLTKLEKFTRLYSSLIHAYKLLRYVCMNETWYMEHTIKYAGEITLIYFVVVIVSLLTDSPDSCSVTHLSPMKSSDWPSVP